MSLIATPVDYFMVWTKSGWAPRRRHMTFVDAMREARRLAELRPGSEYVVLHALGSVSVPRQPISAQAL
jgi:hypothetical protein